MTGQPRSSAAVLVFAVLAVGVLLTLGLFGCGDDGDDNASTPATPRSQVEGGGGDEQPAGQAGAGEDGDGSAPSGASRGSAREPVDLTVDPERIDSAIVTPSGAVQSVPPSPEAHRAAQRNTYGSIRSFGEETEGSEATNITFALLQYLTAKAEGDWATACARLYSQIRENLERLDEDGKVSCPEAFGALMGRVSESRRREQAQIDVSSVRRGEGNRAFVIYKTPATLSADMPMYVEGGVWKVGAVEAYVLTPERRG